MNDKLKNFFFLIGFLIIANFIFNNLFISLVLVYAIAIGLLIFYRIEIGIIFYLTFILFQHHLSLYTSNPLIKNIDELLIIYLTLLTISSVVVRKKKFSHSFVNKYFYLFLFIMVLSIIINQVPLKNIILFTISIVKPILLFFVIINLNKRKIKHLGNLLIKFLLILGLIQVPFVIKDIISTGGISKALDRYYYYVGDFIVGTFASSDTVGYLIIIDIIILFFIFLNQKRIHKKILYGLIFFVFCLILIIASVKRLLITLPIIFAIGMFGIFKKRKINKLLLVMFVVIIASPIYIMEKNLILNNNFRSLDPAANPILQTEKIKAYYDLFNNAREEMPFKSLGAGPGMYGSAVAQNLNAPFAEKYINYYTRMIPEGGGGTLMTRSSAIIALISELGFISLFLVLLILYSIYKKVYDVLKNIDHKYYHLRLYAYIVASLVPVIIILSFFQGIFQGGFIIHIFWCFSGVIFNKSIV